MPSRSRRPLLIAAAGVALAVAVGVAAFLLLAGRGGTDPALTTARAYLAAWSRGDAGAMAALLDRPPPDLAARVGALGRGAPGTRATFSAGRVSTGAAGRVVAYHARADIAGFGPLAWDGELPVVAVGGRRLVRWQPDDLYPGLAEGQMLSVQRTWPTRAPILGADGTPLVSDAPDVVVGIEPDRMKDAGQVQAALKALLGVDPAAVQKDLTAPGVKPNFFVAVTTLPADRFDTLRAQLAPIPGVVFQRSHGRIPAAPGLGQPLLGTVGPVTAERLHQLGAPYRAGDEVGMSGLEALYESRLAGLPAQDVNVVDRNGTVVRSVAHHAGTDPQPVQLTVDLKAQEAAEAALAGVTQPAALVAVDTTTGALRAVASRPADQAFDRALDGRYPPGSTFKIVTAAALLASGTTPSTPAACPPSLSVGGLQFRNFEGEAPGSIPFHRAFAISCNTAFVGLASRLPTGALAHAAATLGFGAAEPLPVATVGGAYPTPADSAEAAASAIGQGRVTASPMHMATVAAAVASGQWKPPTLVLQPQGPGSSAAPATTAPAAPGPGPLDPAVDAALRSLMAEVVTDGTGTAAALPGPAVSGKTGTAEFGNANPPQTHAWFVGFRGNLAFAILVEGGGVGGRVAAPLAAKFLSGVPVS